MSKLKTVEGTGLMMAYRDEQILAAKEMMKKAEERFKLEKDIHHNAKIAFNRMMRYAEDIQECINAELEAMVIERQKLENEYKVKSHSELVAQYGSQGQSEILQLIQEQDGAE